MEEGEGSGRDKQVGGIGNAFFEFKVPRKYSDGDGGGGGGGGSGSGSSLDEVIEFCRFSGRFGLHKCAWLH